jgi:hypothetical protein
MPWKEHELIETVGGGERLVGVAEVVLAELRGHVALRLEELRERDITRLQPFLRAREPHHATRPLHGEAMVRHQQLGHLSPRGRRHSFRLSTSLIAAFSRARSAYIRFNLAFSASSSGAVSRPRPSRLRTCSATEECRPADAVLAQVGDGHATLSLLQDPDDLRLAELRLPHGCSLLRSSLLFRCLPDGGAYDRCPFTPSARCQALACAGVTASCRGGSAA